MLIEKDAPHIGIHRTVGVSLGVAMGMVETVHTHPSFGVDSRKPHTHMLCDPSAKRSQLQSSVSQCSVVEDRYRGYVNGIGN